MDVIASETDVLELMDRLAEQAIADKKLAEMASERAKRLHESVKRRPRCHPSHAGGDGPGENRETSFHRQHRARPQAPRDQSSPLPEAFMRHAPDMILIGKALAQQYNRRRGTRKDQAGLTIRTI